MKLYHTIFYYATDFIAVMQENPVQISTFCPHNMPQAASKLYPAAAKKKYPGRFFSAKQIHRLQDQPRNAYAWPFLTYPV